MPRGGKRPGAGRPKGKSAPTLAKEQAREALRQMVTAELKPMVEAQVKNAKGISFMVYRNKKSGKFRPMPKDKHEQLMGDEDVIVEVWEERPNVSAFTDLLNRALDKPAESVDATVRMPGVEGLLERLLAARKRANG